MGPELIDAYQFATDLTALAVFNQPPVTEKFPADSGSGRVNHADESRAIGILVRKYASLLVSSTRVLYLFKGIGKFISVLWQHMNLKEFVGDTVPAEIIMGRNLPLHVDELPKARAAFSTQVTLKPDHTKILFCENQGYKNWEMIWELL